jgi:hypothetical protein
MLVEMVAVVVTDVAANSKLIFNDFSCTFSHKLTQFPILVGIN